MISFLSHMLAYVVLIATVFAPTIVEANQPEIVYVQDTTYPGEWGLFSRQFVGVKLPADGGFAVVIIRAGDYATGEWVVSFDIRQQSYGLFENEIRCEFAGTGTYWFYLAMFGTDHNFDYLQMRIVPSTWEGEVTPNYQHPPFDWRTGYPPYGVPFKSDGTAGSSDGSVATLPSPIITTIPSHPSQRSSKSITVWLAPLLVGIIMIAITVPIVIFAYKKGKQNAKSTQVEAVADTEAAIQTQQQQDQPNTIQV